MTRRTIAPVSWHHLVVLVVPILVASACFPLSGCVTTLGYVPEYIKPSDQQTLMPTYTEVKKWATDVVDGYDSRATMNRQALYLGSLVAAAGISALAGLAAFHSHSSAVIGIPIGAGFLGGVAAVYQSDEKAEIYARGSRYIKSLIVLSEERVSRYRQDVTLDMSTEVEAAQKAVNTAQIQLKDSQGREATQSQEAQAARKKADAAKNNPGASDAQKQALENSAKALENLDNQEKQAVMAAQVVLSAAQTQLKTATARWAMRHARFEALRNAGKSPSDIIKLLGAEGPDSSQSEFYMSEAICVQKDVNDAMDRVAVHLADLDPKNLAAQLKAVKAAETKTSTGGTASTTAQDQQNHPPDLSDLALPAKSECGP